jgi:hypothetical protein
VKIGGDVKGGTGADSGEIVLEEGVLGSVVINGSIVGGTNFNAGGVFAEAGIGSVKVGHHLIGGSIAGTDSGVDGIGFILSSGGIDRVTIGGSVIAGIDNSTIGQLSNCGTIRANDDMIRSRSKAALSVTSPPTASPSQSSPRAARRCLPPMELPTVRSKP